MVLFSNQSPFSALHLLQKLLTGGLSPPRNAMISKVLNRGSSRLQRLEQAPESPSPSCDGHGSKIGTVLRPADEEVACPNHPRLRALPGRNLVAAIATFALSLAAPSGGIAQQPNPPLADLKAAAEHGDPEAQSKLGDAYVQRSDYASALLWYRKAAAQGIADSQYHLAHITMQRAIGLASLSATKEIRAASADEAVPWFIKAATQGHKRAQIELGQIYEKGTYIVPDILEAYKWFSLAAVGGPLDPGVSEGRYYRDNLILRMPQTQIAEGNRHVAAFSPHRATASELPEPSYVQHLMLDGLSGPPTGRLAVINGKTVAAGEATFLKLDGRTVGIRCIAITDKSATVAVDGVPGIKKLQLRALEPDRAKN